MKKPFGVITIIWIMIYLTGNIYYMLTEQNYDYTEAFWILIVSPILLVLICEFIFMKFVNNEKYNPILTEEHE